MTVKIDKNIPPPNASVKNPEMKEYAKVMETMKVSESFIATAADEGAITNLASLLVRKRNQLNRTFTRRKIEKGVYRIWRTA